MNTTEIMQIVNEKDKEVVSQISKNASDKIFEMVKDLDLSTDELRILITYVSTCFSSSLGFLYGMSAHNMGNSK